MMTPFLLAFALTALPPKEQGEVVAEAKKALGVPYILGGRLRNKSDGLDCQGLLFFALQPISSCGWRSLSVMPTTSVHGELGLPVAQLAPVSSSALPGVLPLLEPGDIFCFLDFEKNPSEPSIARLIDEDGIEKDVWVWHTGMYVGHGRFIVGDHYAGKVVEEELVPYTAEHYAGVFVTRMASGPAPQKCRQHAPMKLFPRR